MFCSNCGKKLEDGSKFCPECGEVFVQEAANAVQQAGTEFAGAVAQTANDFENRVENPAAVKDDSATVFISNTEESDPSTVMINNQAEEAEREARRIEEEAAAQIDRAKAKAEEARAKAEAARAAQMEKAREEMRQKARIDATEAVNLANYKISQAAQVNETQKKAEAEAVLAHQKAQEVIQAAQDLGVTGIPALAALPEAQPIREFSDSPRLDQPVNYGDAAPQTYTAETEPVKYVRPIGYILWQLLYSIPVIGWVFLIVHTFSRKNRNLKYYAISFWIRLVILLIIAAIGLLLYVIFRDNAYVAGFRDNIVRPIWDIIATLFKK
jgi:hypothetical protein